MASPRSIEVKVGILIITALGLLAAFILIMGGINFQPTYKLQVEFDNPGGLQSGAPVKIAGVKVGKIQEVEFRGGKLNSETGKREPLVRVHIEVEKRYEDSIFENATFYVTTLGVLGEQFMAIDPGSSDRPQLPENAVVRGLDPPRLDLLLAEGYELMHSTVTALRENRAEIGEAFDGLRKTLKGTGTFFENNQERLDRVAANVEQMTADGVSLVQGVNEKYVENPQIDRILTNADALTGTLAHETPPLMEDVKATMKNARRISETLGGEQEQKQIKQILGDGVEVMASAKRVSKDAEQIMSHIKQGRGTVGAVVMDEQLYDDVQELARDLKHNPWKFLWRE